MLTRVFLPYSSEDPKQSNLVYWVAAGAAAALAAVFIGVLVRSKRRKEASTVWFPEGFFLKSTSDNKKRREPVGQDAMGLK